MQDMVSASFLGWVTNSNLKMIFSSIIILFLIAIVAKGVDYLFRGILVDFINRWFSNSKVRFLRLIAKHYVLNSMAYLLFGLVFVFGSFILVRNNQPITVEIATGTLKCANLFNLFILTLTVNRLILVLHDYYENTSRHAKQHPIHSYVRVIIFTAWLLMVILGVSYAFNRSPIDIIAGIGAISAFLLLIFRDTFLGIVASIQASASAIVRIGDWVSIDKYKVDGVVTDISITNVKIKNWDNTVTTLPTYALTAEAVQNWDYMLDSGGRRLKESIMIDISSIKFCNAELLNKLKNKYPVIEEYLKNNPDTHEMTNLQLFREFLLQYFKIHNLINTDLTTLVYSSAPGITGVPLEIYTFTKDVSFVGHMQTKSEIFEFICASIVDFELKTVQKA